MYELVNKTLRAYLVERCGEQRWEAIRAKADIEVEAFVRMQAYLDEVTYALAAPASQQVRAQAQRSNPSSSFLRCPHPRPRRQLTRPRLGERHV